MTDQDKYQLISMKRLIFVSQSLQPPPMYQYSMSTINQGKYPRTKGKCTLNLFKCLFLFVFSINIFLSFFPLNRLSSSSTLWPWNCSTPNVASRCISCWRSSCSVTICSVLPSIQPTAVWPAAGPPGHDTLPWTGWSAILKSLLKHCVLIVSFLQQCIWN